MTTQKEVDKWMFDVKIQENLKKVHGWNEKEIAERIYNSLERLYNL